MPLRNRTASRAGPLRTSARLVVSRPDDGSSSTPARPLGRAPDPSSTSRPCPGSATRSGPSATESRPSSAKSASTLGTAGSGTARDRSGPSRLARRRGGPFPRPSGARGCHAGRTARDAGKSARFPRPGAGIDREAVDSPVPRGGSSPASQPAHAVQAVEQRRLPGAVGPDQADRLAALDPSIETWSRATMPPKRLRIPQSLQQRHVSRPPGHARARRR